MIASEGRDENTNNCSLLTYNDFHVENVLLEANKLIAPELQNHKTSRYARIYKVLTEFVFYVLQAANITQNKYPLMHSHNQIMRLEFKMEKNILMLFHC